MDKKDAYLLAIATVAIGSIGFSVTSLYGQEDAEGAMNVLKNDAKLEQVKTMGKGDFLDCRGATAFRTKFKAVSNGEKVSGNVCENWINPANVRFDKTPKF